MWLFFVGGWVLWGFMSSESQVLQDVEHVSVGLLEFSFGWFEGELRVDLVGRLDSLTATEFYDRLLEADRDEVCELMRLDFSGVTGLGSAGLRSLLQLARRLHGRGGGLVVESPSRGVREIFVISGFDQVLTLEPAEEELEGELG